MKKTRTIVFLGMFIAMNIVLVRLLAFMPLPSVRFDFGFLPIALSSAMFGPVLGGVTAVIADIIGYILAGKGNYFPGLTISAFVTGTIYGVLLFKKSNTLLRIIIAAVLNVLLVEVLMNTVWLSILLDTEVLAILPGRLIKAAIMLPTQICIVYALCKALKVFIRREVISQN